MVTRRKTGDYVTGSLASEHYRAFVPTPLAPEPPLVFEPELIRAIEHATVQLGRLDGIGSMLPDANLFLFHYVRKEAVLSSQIEGTQSSLSDLLLHCEDAVLVLNRSATARGAEWSFAEYP